MSERVRENLPRIFFRQNFVASMSLHLVYVCDLLQISVVNLLVVESRFSFGNCDQFYRTNSFLGNQTPWVTVCPPYFAKYHTTSDYHMVSNGMWFKYHTIYGTIESMVPAQLCFGSLRECHLIRSGAPGLHILVRTSCVFSFCYWSGNCVAV